MQTALIVAMDQHGLIGTDSGLPWRLPRDLKRFRKLTLHKPILMGRRTHEMIGKPLDLRLNLVLSRDTDYRADGCRVIHSLEEGLAAAREYLRAGAGSGDELLIIGGAATGAFIISNPITVIKRTLGGFGDLMKGAPYSKDNYLELLSMLYTVFKMAKSKGMLALEQHVDEVCAHRLEAVAHLVKQRLQLVCERFHLANFQQSRPP